MQRDGVDRVLRDAGSHPMQRPKLYDRRKHHSLHRELLNALQQGLSCGPIPLHRLLLKQRIDVGISPIRIGPFGRDERLHTGRRVPGRSGPVTNRPHSFLSRQAA